jgi:hypothetical protein
MKAQSICLAVVLAVAFSIPWHADAGSDRIYGKVYTREDTVYEGVIRWDDHETFWDDILDATKQVTVGVEGRRRQKHNEIEILGIKISWTEEDEDREGDRRFGIRMGRLASIQRRSRKAAVLTLKDDTRLRVTSSGTDIGSANRGIIIEDQDLGRITLDWSEFEKIEFAQRPAGPAADDEVWRLYGTVTGWDGRQFEGFILWDNDERLSSDVLDGESRDEDVEIPFSKIRAIERKSSSSARVELISGKKIRLRGTNDVDDDNRGIVVRVPHFGQVTFDWDDFERAEFIKPDPKTLQSYDDYDSGDPLYGTVWDDDGDRYRGRIHWDADESTTYEFIDGEMDDLDVMIELSDIQSIERHSSRSARVKLKSGESLVLKGTCDVNDENRGIIIEEEGGGKVRLYWDEFDRVEFGRP